MVSDTTLLANTVSFDLVGTDLGRDVESALKTALTAGVVFPKGGSPLSIFRETLASSIRAIDTHHRGPLFQEFLLKGPYEDAGAIPKELVAKRLSDADTDSVITFIYSHMVNCFKGAVTELLATAACLRLMKKLQKNGEIPENTMLYVGDAVSVHRAKGKGVLKGADLHILVEAPGLNATQSITVAGVAEVKSYFPSEHKLCEQLDKHLRRAKQGLQINGIDYPADKVNVGYGKNLRVIRIAVLPSDWKLPRTFRFENTTHSRLLHVDLGVPLRNDDEIVMTGDDEWRITLRWSKEAITQAAYEMTFWYMEKVGEIIYADPKAIPKDWAEMTPAEAGRNAAKMMLYYAILRCRTARESQRAIALYNTYGFGYAIGMNFMNKKGRREMLWPQDLDEILASGKTKAGCYIH